MTHLSTPLPVAPAYRNEIRFTLIAQVLVTLFSLLLLDGGVVAKIVGCTMSGFWLGVAIVILRRPRNPRPGDLLYVRWGFFMILPLGVLLAQAIQLLRHA